VTERPPRETDEREAPTPGRRRDRSTLQLVAGVTVREKERESSGRLAVSHTGERETG
jgi:hypothetical protein